MTMSRRDVLVGATAAAAASALPFGALGGQGLPALDPVTIYADGVTNDAPALNAILAGAPFIMAPDAMGIIERNGDQIVMKDLNVALSEPIRFPTEVQVCSVGGIFTATEDFSGDAMLIFQGGDDVSLGFQDARL